MSKQCLQCGKINEDHQHFCNQCGNPLPQSEGSQSRTPLAGFYPVGTNPNPPQTPVQPSPPQNPQGNWQATQVPPPGAHQGPQAMPAPVQYTPPTQPPYQHPPYDAQWQAKPSDSGFNKSKGMFMDMINAHKSDADPEKEEDQIKPRKYPALKFYMAIFRILAWLMAASMVIIGIVGFAMTVKYAWYMAIFMLPLGVLGGFVTLVATYGGIEFIRMLINIEDNTRRAANK